LSLNAASGRQTAAEEGEMLVVENKTKTPEDQRRSTFNKRIRNTRGKEEEQMCCEFCSTAGLEGELHLLPSSPPLTHWLIRLATPTLTPSAS